MLHQERGQPAFPPPNGRCFSSISCFFHLQYRITLKCPMKSMPQGKKCVSRSLSSIPPSAGGMLGVRLPLLPGLHLSCHFLCCLYVSCCIESVHSGFSSSSGESFVHVGVDSVCMWEEASSGSFCATVLDFSSLVYDILNNLIHHFILH